MNHHNHTEDKFRDGHSEISVQQKLVKLLKYWTEHNQEHAKSYLEWSKRAETEGLKELSELLQQAARDTASLNNIFKKALERI